MPKMNTNKYKKNVKFLYYDYSNKNILNYIKLTAFEIQLI